MSPGSPEGRRRYSSEDYPPRTRKRAIRSESKSPVLPNPTRPQIQDISHDDAWNGF